MPLSTTRKIVKDGISAYFGGTFQNEGRCWQGGPLVSSGLGTVRKAFPKRLNDNDFFQGVTVGRNMGAFMIVEVPFDQENREGIAGPPVNDGNGNITSGGIKKIIYRVTLNVYHLSFKQLAEDATDDVDQLVEAIKQQIRLDRTLGFGTPGAITQAGEGRFGIQTRVYPTTVDADRTRIGFQVTFEVMSQIIA